MKKRIAAMLIAALVIICVCYMTEYSPADCPTATQSASVQLRETENGWMLDGMGTESALIFYPGGKVEPTAYLPLLERLAENGTDVFLVKMPCNLAVLRPNGADALLENYSYEKWYIGGHSLGGAMAAAYSAEHIDDLDGLLLLAAYGTKDISNTSLRVLSLYGSEDGVLNMEKLEAAREYMPDSYEEQCIMGGNHANFGCYGEQKGDGTANISAEEQQRQTAELILEKLIQ